MKTLRILIVILTGAFALVVLKFFFFPGNKNIPAPAKGFNAPVSVTGFVVKPQRFENIVQSNGTIYASEEAELRVEIAGKITLIRFKEGGMVNKGDLLVKINDADLQAGMKKLNAQLKLANDKLERQKKLVGIGGISKEEFEINETMASNIESDIDFTRAQIAKTEIHAPFSGSIGLKNISEGNYVNASTVIATIQQLNPVKIDFAVPEKYLAYIKQGDKIKFFSGESGKSYEAEIAAIEPMIDASTRSVKIRAYAANKDKTLYPGAFVHIEIVVNISDNAFLIPTESVVPVLKGKKVFVSRSGIVDEINIETGERTQDKVEVLSGLSAGDTVLTTGVLQVRKGSPVKFTVLK
ncbi:MAG TPA: efflux RND transporter periplasmic adaptor subunit [Bacteroidia bacterium]|nr:efflux RND transporter periplasmic adaptor subunit [Bacteroidia bacterium]